MLFSDTSRILEQFVFYIPKVVKIKTPILFLVNLSQITKHIFERCGIFKDYECGVFSLTVWITSCITYLLAILGISIVDNFHL